MKSTAIIGMNLLTVAALCFTLQGPSTTKVQLQPQPYVYERFEPLPHMGAPAIRDFCKGRRRMDTADYTFLKNKGNKGNKEITSVDF